MGISAIIEEELGGPVTVAVEDGSTGAVRLFRRKVVLAYLDSPVYDFEPTEIEFQNQPVPVYGEDMKPLGHAAVYLDRTGAGVQRLVADVTIDAASEERLLAETQQVKLYPRLFGVLAVAAIPLFDFHAPITPVRLRLDGVVLSRRAPADGRVPPFGELFV